MPGISLAVAAGAGEASRAVSATDSASPASGRRRRGWLAVNPITASFLRYRVPSLRGPVRVAVHRPAGLGAAKLMPMALGPLDCRNIEHCAGWYGAGCALRKRTSDRPYTTTGWRAVGSDPARSTVRMGTPGAA